jgi:hypothetical protein
LAEPTRSATYQNEVILNPGFSRVKDLARIGTGLWLFGVSSRRGFLADPREILHGLKAAQDDVLK